MNCLNGFESEIIRNDHYEYCKHEDSVRVKMPTKDKSIVKYTDGKYQFKVPFVIYADFESILVPVSSAAGDPDKPSTRSINVHEPSGWCINSTFTYEKRFNKIKQYRGKDCVSKFCETIMLEAKRLYKSAPQKPMDELNDKQQEEYRNGKKMSYMFKRVFS